MGEEASWLMVTVRLSEQPAFEETVAFMFFLMAMMGDESRSVEPVFGTEKIMVFMVRPRAAMITYDIFHGVKKIDDIDSALLAGIQANRTFGGLDSWRTSLDGFYEKIEGVFLKETKRTPEQMTRTVAPIPPAK